MARPVKHILIDLPSVPDGRERLEKLDGIEATILEPADGPCRPAEELARRAHVLACEETPENVSDMTSLEFVQLGSSGYSHLFGLGLPERGVRACNARGVFDVPIAEWNVAMMINLWRDVRGMIRHQEKGVWDRSDRFQRELRGGVVGIWGYGGIGRETARLAKALGLTVHVLTRGPVRPRERVYRVPGTGDPEGVLPDRVFTTGEETSFLAGLDFLILAMPLTNTTEGIVGETELRALPRGAFVLNPARGPLIQEPALLRALNEHWIAGAALDTHHHYPMDPDHPLWRFENVIMTPHVSGSSSSQHFAARVWDLFLQNVERFMSGTPLLNELTTDELSGR